MPKDPYMLLSYVNTQLRDHFSSLDELAAANVTERSAIEEKLASIGYFYDADRNCFAVKI